MDVSPPAAPAAAQTTGGPGTGRTPGPTAANPFSVVTELPGPPMPERPDAAGDHILARMPEEQASLVPREVLTARVGRGTVGSELERTIRVRLDGDGPASGRQLVPETAAAARLLESEHGPKLERALRGALGVADAHEGAENLRTITLTPDEHAVKASRAVDAMQVFGRRTGGPPGEIVMGRVLGQDTEAIGQQIVNELTGDVAESVAFAAAWNADGHVTLMPDVSRELLSSVGLYRIQPGDGATRLPPPVRAEAAREAWRTLVHEAHHSVTPAEGGYSDTAEHVNVFEESVPSVLEDQQWYNAARRGGADVQLATQPARDVKDLPVDWDPWNRSHLPRPPAEKVATAGNRYRSGPKMIAEALRHAGLDRRTTEGRQRAVELLQGGPVEELADRIADAITERHGLDAQQRTDLVTAIEWAALEPEAATFIEEIVSEGPKAPPPSAPS